MKFDNPYNIFLYDKAFELGTLYDNNYKSKYPINTFENESSKEVSK